MNIKQRIESISNPAAMNRRSFITVGEILTSNEKNNQCTISYTDKTGNRKVEKGVPLLYHDEKILSWFPVKGDQVYLQVNENATFIISAYSSDYQLNAATKKLQKQILASYDCDNEGNLI